MDVEHEHALVTESNVIETNKTTRNTIPNEKTI